MHSSQHKKTVLYHFFTQSDNALGWKVNGASGEGGTLTVLCNESSSQQREFLAAVRDLNPLFQPIPIYLSRTGLRVWESEAGRDADFISGTT